MPRPRISPRWLHSKRVPATALALAGATVVATSETEKPPIYPHAERRSETTHEPSALELQIRSARLATADASQQAYGHVHGLIHRWIGVEHAVEARLKSLRAPDEPLTPGALYVGIATLSGSILARTRSFPVRAVLPPTLFFLAAQRFLPRTTANVLSYAEELEERFAPGLGHVRRTGVAHTAGAWAQAREAAHSVSQSMGEGLEGGVRAVEDATSLRLSEAFGWGKREMEKAGELAQQASVKAREVGEQAQVKAVEAVEAAKASALEQKAKAQDKAADAKKMV